MNEYMTLCNGVKIPMVGFGTDMTAYPSSSYYFLLSSFFSSFPSSIIRYLRNARTRINTGFFLS